MSIQTGATEWSLSSLTKSWQSCSRAPENWKHYSVGPVWAANETGSPDGHARMDFERFRKTLPLELTDLHTSLSQALSILVEARTMSSSSSGDPFQFLAPNIRASYWVLGREPALPKVEPLRLQHLWRAADRGCDK